ncbi:Pyruvate flavodoxin/ferredoxin oxidoreductase domain protein [Candidatus Terasakiella magnetica]|uniref:Pyruvate flavodoxin/ferredoxin oxidoreductase domain protein n=1 Tax=Candidatus Terasakiella magnetica TaxID=1867952 RepID=A0A1C3REF7_9PROT|nr:2-oxoacid:acceptor oxidoreductase subunit alpha [Candidatus Terasakiella magnetica]SCA55622.1 Pyruvate flavodoxin/ferredoxin oxidoreductase domain protein [Candidatus Terasakiella magnetica]
MTSQSVSIAITGAGGAGVMTAGQMLLDAAAKAGLYGLMTRSSGPQIRGGEAAAFIRLSAEPINCPDDHFDVLFCFDWMNVDRFAAELPLRTDSVIIGDEAAKNPPEMITDSIARQVMVPLSEAAKEIEGGRPNMIGLGILGELAGIPLDALQAILEKVLKRKGQAALDASLEGMKKGMQVARDLEAEIGIDLHLERKESKSTRWSLTGNEAAGMGALRGGVRFCAAYPITPATEILEWLAPNLEKVGGTLVQAEDELASVNMIIGGSFGGVPSITATSGPGLALMSEALGLAVSAEIPIVVVDVMRGGPSTGIPTKSEQSDLNIALHGLHGDAPHIVTAPSSISDCLFTTQWTVHLAEAMQTAAIVLSDQSLGQSRNVIDKPADLAFVAQREVATGDLEDYKRYALTDSGVSPMAIPGTAGGEYVADGLETAENARPSSSAEDHYAQLDKRQRKLDQFDYGQHWAEIEGEGELAVITFGSVTAPVREAIKRLEAEGEKIKMISMRLLMPALPDKMDEALAGVTKALVVEQTHSKQFYRYLRSEFDLPAQTTVLAKPGPLPFRPNEIVTQIKELG